MACIAVNLQPMVKLETCDSRQTAVRDKLGEIYQTSLNRWLFVCSRCLQEFPLFLQFATHAQTHLADPYSQSCQSYAENVSVENIELKPNIEFITDHIENSENDDNRIGDDGDCTDERTDEDSSNDHDVKEDYVSNRTTTHTFECFICHLPFTSRRHCHQHLLEHSGYRHQCDYCMEKFVRKGIAKYHRSKCGPANQFKCTLCPLKFYNKPARKKHNRTCPAKINRNHAHDTFACNRCSVTFADQLHYARHMQTHEIPIYRCTNCAFDTYVAANMQSHIARCTKTCPICQKVLTTRYTFRTHMLQHQNVRNFQCATCGKQFVSKNGLDKHMLTHTGERKYMCDLCPMAFKRSDKLLRHRRLHANDDERTCKFCSKFFRVKLALERHAMKVHGLPWDAEVKVAGSSAAADDLNQGIR